MKTIIITGSNSGIGKEAAVILAKQSHTVVMLSRPGEKSVQAREEIISRSRSQNVFLIPADLSEPDSIREAVDFIKKSHPVVDVLVNNAGIYHVKREETSKGIEVSFAVNFLAPFMLTRLLLENVEASGNGRIINVVSELYRKGSIDADDPLREKRYKGQMAYANAKRACVMDTFALADKTRGKGVTVNALHPGLLATSVFRDYPAFLVKFLNLFLEHPKKGGERIVHLALSDDVKDLTGTYVYREEPRKIEWTEEESFRFEKLQRFAEELTGVAH
ncbi:MAG: SDR family NAD(P)-dependent oxidoreductase [Candidatus Aminicenantes bacterium]|nr:SDR family NAD(P)-dependent oxidoreductase [Candidatus Aminicenantes bacterium]